MDCRGGETSASCISHQRKKCKAKVDEAVEAHPSYRRRASMQLLKASSRAAIPSTSADESGPDALKVIRLRFSICNESDRFVSPFAETVGSYLGFARHQPNACGPTYCARTLVLSAHARIGFKLCPSHWISDLLESRAMVKLYRLIRLGDYKALQGADCSLSRLSRKSRWFAGMHTFQGEAGLTAHRQHKTNCMNLVIL